MKNKCSGWECRTTVIAVDSYRDSVPVGRIYNPFLNSGESFTGAVSMLSKLENLMNEMNFPQSYNITRGFTPGSFSSPAEIGEQTGAAATFAVKVMFRQNSSWQGSVTWLEGKSEETFRSALELIFLMDSAISGERVSS